MGITYKKIALYYLLLSFFFGVISAILKGQSIVLYGDILIVSLVFVTLFTKKLYRGSTQLIALIILALLGMLGIFRYGFNLDTFGIFFLSRGFFVFLVTILFFIYTFLKLDNDELIKVDLFIENVIKLNILAILVEGIAVNYFGLQSYLFEIFSSADYRINPNPVFFDFVPNGLVFGRQNASIISVIGVLLWFPWNKDRRRGIWQYYWLFASGVSWALTITTTSILCFIIPLLFITYSGLVKKRRLIWIIFSSLIIFGAISYYQYFIFMRYQSSVLRINSIELFIEGYYSIFTEPIDQIKRNSWEFFMGTGQLLEKNNKYSIIFSSLESFELGLLTIAIKYGAILVGITLVFFLTHIFRLLRFFRESIVSEVEKNIIFRSFCITLPLIVSLIHYTTLFKPGIVQLMAAAIALPYALRKKKEKNRRILNLHLASN